MTKAETHGAVLDWIPDGLPDLSQKRRRGVRVTTAAAAALGLALSGAGAGTGGPASDTSSNSFDKTKPRSGPGTPPPGSLTPWGPDRTLPGRGGGLHKGNHPMRLLSSG